MSVIGAIIGWVLGALLTVGVPLAAGMPPPFNIVPLVPLPFALLVFLFLVFLLYLLASLTTVNAQPSTFGRFPEWCLGVMIGLNAGANFMLAIPVVFLLFGPAAFVLAPVVAGVLSLINWLACVRSLARDATFAAVLGWVSWLLPMSWLATGVGLVFFIINGVASALVGVRFSPSWEWWTGTVVVWGGVTYPFPTGFNLGNFSFIHRDFGFAAPWLDTTYSPPQLDPRTLTGITFHETGHTLNVAACGGLFHYIGAIDESWIAGTLAFSEQLAEGHLHDAVQPWIDWWRPQIAAIGGAQANAPAINTGTTPDIPAPGVIAVGTPISFDRSAIAALAGDPDGYPQGSVNPGPIVAVGFLWTVGTAPAGSRATFAAPTASTDTFTPDVGGDYTIQLDYSDGINGSPSTAPFTTPRSPPLGFTPAAGSPSHVTNTISVVEARVTAVFTGAVNTSIALSSSGTTAGSLIFPMLQWTITSQPAGSNPSIDFPTSTAPNFTTDTAGTYTLTLTASVGSVSHSATARVDVA